MSNRVYTYSNINELKDASYYREILTVPQIAMSKEMSAIKFKMPGFGRNITSFNSFQKELFPDWNDGSQRFKYITILNKFMREKIGKTSDNHEKEWLYGCKKNLNVAISNIIKLEEAFVKPEDIVEDDRDINLFKEMWKYLIDNDDSIRSFRKRREELKEADAFAVMAETTFAKCKVKTFGRKTLVFNGFQFFTPIQRFVFECFQNAGYDIFALIQYDDKYPYANEIWNHLYNGKNGFPSKNEWIRQKSLDKNVLGEILESGEKSIAPNIKLIKYNNSIEFVEDIDRIKSEGYYIYSADDRAANNLLRDYYPENYEVRNLLAYPIGQFIYTIHKMWDENLQCVALNKDNLRKCFASGWLSYKGISSSKYTEDLEKLLPFFNGCYTLNEWQDRINTLGDAFDEAIDYFKDENGDKKTVRTKELLGNPFSNFGVFSVDEDREDAVMGIIAELIKLAKTLFGKNEPISIQKHMSNLDAMLHMNDGIPQELFMKERETVKKIFSALESDRVRDFQCYPGDLAAALIVLMSDNLDEEDEKLEQPRVLVFNLFQVESAPIAAKGKVHICMSDIQKLPGGSGKYTWPIDEELLNNINKNTKNKYVDEWLKNNKLNALSNRYYIYSAAQNESVEISWVEKQGDKLFSPSPYITLIDKLTDSKITESENREIELMNVANVLTKKKLDKGFDISISDIDYQYEEELEYALCPMRFVYSYILGNSPSYRNEFQQNRAIVRLIQVFNVLFKGRYSIEQIAENVFELFPGIRKAEMRQMIDDAKSWNLPYNDGGYSKYGEKEYTYNRINLKFLDQDVFNVARRSADMLMGVNGRKNITYQNVGPDGEKNCMFCPHVPYCRRAKYGVDYKGDRR